MSGQQQILVLNQESLFEKFAKENLKQADLYYAEKKFKVGEGMDELKTLHAYILKDVLCEDDCEIVKFLDKKLRGALGDENLELVELKSLQPKYRDINNYYYTQPFSWEESVW